MSITYSLYKGQIIESERKGNIYSVLQNIPDNTQKLISPKDVRDGFLTAWANSAIKLTSNGTYSYIGIDSGNPSDRDLKYKIFLGKRSYNNNNIVTDTLLSSDSDIFFFNTKEDSNPNINSTKISILAGTNSALHLNAPYIQATRIGSNINLLIKNDIGTIDIISGTGNVSINGIKFPTIEYNQSSAIDGRYLKYVGQYPYGELQWSDITFTSQVGSTGSKTDIYGQTVSLNNYSLEFINDDVIPVDIGDIKQGDSFSAGSFDGQNWPLTEVVRKLLYPYIEPVLELSLYNADYIDTDFVNYFEVGNSVKIGFSYSLTTYARNEYESISQYFLRTESTASATWSIISGTAGPLSGTPGTIFSFDDTYPFTGTYSIGDTLDFSLYASTINGTNSLDPYSSMLGYTHSVSGTVKFIGPFMFSMDTILYGFTGPDLDSLISSIPPNNKVLDVYTASTVINANLLGVGYLYFLYPSSYPVINKIKDNNGFTIYDSSIISSSKSFTYSSVTPSISTQYGSYRIYRTNYIASIPGSSYSVYQFIF